MTIKPWLAVLVLLALNGCAGMGKSQCISADWRTIGFEDGANGKAETAISSYRQDCADHGVAPNLDAYRQGHREGAERFCTNRNGFAVAKRGAGYANSCPAELEAAFLAGFADGKIVHSAQRELNNARSAVDKQQRQISALEKDISAKTELLVEDGQTKEQRVALLTEIETLKNSLLDSIKLLPTLERDVRRAQQNHAQVEQRFSHYQ